MFWSYADHIYIFNVSGLPGKNLEHSHRKSIDYAILETKLRS